jgi:outer membrane cobalamin receptor
MTMSRWFGVWLVLVPAGVLAQQPAAVSGRVVDRQTGRSVPGAELRLADEHRQTSDDGRFHFGNVAPGMGRLEVRAIGYGATSRNITILTGLIQEMVIELEPLPVVLEELSVLGVAERVIRGSELAARGSDLATALNGWQGIVVSRTGAGQEAVPIVRGSAADEVLVLLDGFPLNDPFTGRADLSRIPVRDVESVALTPGAQSARAGARAMAGVLEIETRRVVSPEVSVGVGSFEQLRVRGAAGIRSASAALTYERIPNEFAVTGTDGSDITRENAGGELWVLHAGLRSEVDLTVRATKSDRGLPGTTVNPTTGARGRDRSLLIGLETGRKFFARASAQWLDTRASDATPPPGFVAYDAHTWGTSGTVALGVRGRRAFAGWQGEFSAAVDGRHDRFEGDGVQDDATVTRGGLALAAMLTRLDGGAVWTMAPAVRIDAFSGKRYGSGRLDLSYLRGGTSLSGAIGSAVTAPALADLIFRDGVGVALNPDLRPERIRWEAELGLGHDFMVGSRETSVRLRGFYGRVDDLILWSPNFRFIWSPGNFDVLRRGGEAIVDFDPADNLQLSATASFSAITYDAPGGAQVRYRPRVSYSLHGRWSPGPWRLALGWNRVGIRYTTNVGTNPLPPINLWNVAVERTIGEWVSLRGEVRDLTDSRPAYIAGFPSPGRSFHLSFNLEFP